MTHSSSTRLLIAIVAVTVAPTAQAQNAPAYTIRVGDTLRYTERTDARIEIDTPGGTAQMTSEHVATIAVAFTTADSARAWYESLLLRQVGPGPLHREPNTATLLRQPYHLSVAPSGVVRAAVFPTIPKEIADLTDLTRQFDDFFITLPRQPLTMGVAWSDTLTSDRSAQPGGTLVSRSVRSYRVERDTVVGGVRAVVIRVDHELRIDASSPMEGQNATVHVTLAGTERGTAIFASGPGRLLARKREGTLQGTFSMASGSTRTDMPQRYEYTGTLSLVP